MADEGCRDRGDEGDRKSAPVTSAVLLGATSSRPGVLFRGPTCVGVVSCFLDVEGRSRCAVEPLEHVPDVAEDSVVRITQSRKEAACSRVGGCAAPTRRAADEDGLFGKLGEPDQRRCDVGADPIERAERRALEVRILEADPLGGSPDRIPMTETSRT